MVERGASPRVQWTELKSCSRMPSRVCRISAQISRWHRPRGSAGWMISAGCRRSRERRSTRTDRICARRLQGQTAAARNGWIDGAPTAFPDYESYDWRIRLRRTVRIRGRLAPGEPAIYLWGAPVGSVAATGVENARLRGGSAPADREHISQSDELWNTVLARLKFRPVLLVGYVTSPRIRRVPSKDESEIPGISTRSPPPNRSSTTHVGASSRDWRAGLQHLWIREFMSIAANCECRDGLHIHAENLVVETRDPGGNGPSEILVTDLHNYGMPFVRYETAISARWRTPCRCGRGLRGPRLSKAASSTRSHGGRPDGSGRVLSSSVEGDPGTHPLPRGAEEHRSDRHFGRADRTAVRP